MSVADVRAGRLPSTWTHRGYFAIVMDATIQRIHQFFRLDSPLTAAEDARIARYHALLRNYPVTQVFWLGRSSTSLVVDLFADGGIDHFTEAQVILMAERLSARSVDLLLYPSCPLGRAALPHLWETGVLRLVEEQLAVEEAPVGGDFRSSRLWAAYTAVEEAHGPLMSRAIRLICEADVACMAGGTGRSIIGPSTVLGAGLGAICIGRLVDEDYYYHGDERHEEEVSTFNVYRVRLRRNVIIDGSRVACLANTKNSSRQPNMAMVTAYGGVWARLIPRRRVWSEELFVDYGAPLEGGEGFIPAWIP